MINKTWKNYFSVHVKVNSHPTDKCQQTFVGFCWMSVSVAIGRRLFSPERTEHVQLAFVGVCWGSVNIRDVIFHKILNTTANLFIGVCCRFSVQCELALRNICWWQSLFPAVHQKLVEKPYWLVVRGTSFYKNTSSLQQSIRSIITAKFLNYARLDTICICNRCKKSVEKNQGTRNQNEHRNKHWNKIT